MLLPPQLRRILKDRYLRQFDQRAHEDDGSSGEYATEQVESNVHRAVNELANAVLRKQLKERHKCDLHPSTAPAEGSSAELLVPESPSNPLRGSQKAHQTSKPVEQRHINTPKPSTAPNYSKRTERTPAHAPADRGRCNSAKTHLSSQSSSATCTPQIETSAEGTPIFQHRPAQIKERAQVTASTVKTRSNVRARVKGKPTAPKLRPTALQTTVKQKARKARQTAQRHMIQRMVMQARKTAKATATVARRVTGVVLRAAATLARSLVGLIGGGSLLIALILVIIIAAVANSPFGLFFAAEQNAPDTVSVVEAVAAVNMAYNTKLEELQAGSYDNIVVHGQIPDWPDVLAVFAVKLAGADAGGVDVATLDPDRVGRLTAVFWDMTAIDMEVEAIYHPGDEEEDTGWTEYVLHITITAKSADDMRAAYSFTVYQNNALDELLADRAALSSLAGDLTITSTDLAGILKNLPADLSPERCAAVEAALRLVGKVTYFWGGKSHAIGWDSRWGTLQKVWAPGDSTTGTYRPYGLDCSGFVDWVFNNSMSYVIGHGGGVIMQHTYCMDIPMADAQPGDLAFFPDDSHIGIVVGRDANGNLLVSHCSYSQNNIVVTEFASTGFAVVGRPNVLD